MRPRERVSVDVRTRPPEEFACGESRLRIVCYGRTPRTQHGILAPETALAGMSQDKVSPRGFGLVKEGVYLLQTEGVSEGFAPAGSENSRRNLPGPGRWLG